MLAAVGRSDEQEAPPPANDSQATVAKPQAATKQTTKAETSAAEQEDPETPWHDEPWYQQMDPEAQAAAAKSIAAAEKPLTLDLSLDWTNAYYFRGVLKEDTGVILQPSAVITANLSDTDDDVQYSAVLGTWSSFHGAKTGANTSDSFSETWYELDLYGGLGASWDSWTAFATYYFYLSPSDAYDTSHELELLLEYDDTDTSPLAFALLPHVRMVIETGGPPLTEPDRGVYLELGIAPQFQWQVSNDLTLDIAIPAKVGLSLDDYYQDPFGVDQRFGYFDVGLDVSMPLPELFFGTGRLTAGAHWLHLGTTTRQINDNRADEFIGRIGVSYSF
jgi:hypothetical protein